MKLYIGLHIDFCQNNILHGDSKLLKELLKKSVVYVSVIREKVSHTYTGMYLTFTGFVQESAGVSGNAVISFTSLH